MRKFSVGVLSRLKMSSPSLLRFIFEPRILNERSRGKTVMHARSRRYHPTGLTGNTHAELSLPVIVFRSVILCSRIGSLRAPSSAHM